MGRITAAGGLSVSKCWSSPESIFPLKNARQFECWHKSTLPKDDLCKNKIHVCSEIVKLQSDQLLRRNKNVMICLEISKTAV